MIAEISILNYLSYKLHVKGNRAKERIHKIFLVNFCVFFFLSPKKQCCLLHFKYLGVPINGKDQRDVKKTYNMRIKNIVTNLLTIFVKILFIKSLNILAHKLRE